MAYGDHVKAAEHATERCIRIKPNGEQCKRHPIRGGTVCPSHGGHLPPVKRAAEFRLARDKAQQEVLQRLKAEKAGRVEIVTEMDRLAAEVVAWKDVVRARLEQLAPEQWRYEGKTGEQLHAIVALYERTLDRCNTVLATNVKLGIAERKQELDKAQAVLVVSVIRSILQQLDLSYDQQRLAAQVVPTELRALSGELVQGELVSG